MKVVLFDIDGTLISTLGSGKRALQAALIEHFGTPGPDDYRYDGKTDRQITRELMQLSGFADPHIDERMGVVLDQYLVNLRVELTTAVISIYPGIEPLLDALHARSDVAVGLLTGNVEPGARLKLEAAKVGMHRFRFGAYGSDHERRDALPAIAQTRAAALLAREVHGDALVIIGDTPNDVTCGRSVGARAIGVATGHFSVAALREHGPAAAFDDLADTERVLEAIFGA